MFKSFRLRQASPCDIPSLSRRSITSVLFRHIVTPFRLRNFSHYFFMVVVFLWWLFEGRWLDYDVCIRWSGITCRSSNWWVGDVFFVKRKRNVIACWWKVLTFRKTTKQHAFIWNRKLLRNLFTWIISRKAHISVRQAWRHRCKKTAPNLKQRAIGATFCQVIKWNVSFSGAINCSSQLLKGF